MPDGERLGESADEQHLRRLYDAVNARDAPALLATMTADVDWPDAWRGGRLHGRAEVGAYWRAQWDAVDLWLRPDTVTVLADGRVAVDVDHSVRDDDGTVLIEARVRHVYRLRDGRVARMDVAEPPPG